jgi:glycosyltransferase involved in cell wall biosynthesis
VKALIISPVPTDPVDAGNRARIATMTQLFARWGWDVHFAYVPLELANIEASQQRFGAERFHALRFDAPMPGWPARIGRKVARMLKLDAGYRWALDAWFDDGLLAQLRTLHARHRFDLVCVEYVFMSKALEAFDGDVIRVLDTHDCFADRHRRYLAQGQTPQWYSTSEENETRGFLRANAVLAIQAQEARSFGERVLRRHPRDCTVLEFGHILPEVHPVRPSDAPAGIFLGSDNPINVSALQWFIDEVMPLVLAELPAFRLKVVGSVCKSIADAGSIDKLGFVDDLADAFALAGVNVNPIQMGTGVNIKLLDAMMYGMPCLSTMTGARGLEDYASKGLTLIADDDRDGFARSIVEHLRDPALRDASAKAARAAAIDWNARQQRSFQAWIDTRREPASET